MSYFFCADNLAVGQEVKLAGPEARHILLSRRTKPGQKISLQDPKGLRFSAEVFAADKNTVKVKILGPLPVPSEPRVFLTLYLSVISEAALDIVLQKGTELGLGKLVLFNSINTATKLGAEVFAKKKVRWEKIVKESAKQCDRGIWPELEFLSDLAEVKQSLANYDKIILFDIVGKSLNSVGWPPNLKSLALLVGPEGGFSDTEVDVLGSLPKADPVTLGPVLLRADTACLAGLIGARLLTS